LRFGLTPGYNEKEARVVTVRRAAASEAPARMSQRPAAAFFDANPELGSVLALGLEALLREQAKPGQVRDPAMWLAQYLKRHHPAHSSPTKRLITTSKAYTVGTNAAASAARAAVSAAMAKAESAVAAEQDSVAAGPTAADAPPAEELRLSTAMAKAESAVAAEQDSAAPGPTAAGVPPAEELRLSAAMTNAESAVAEEQDSAAPGPTAADAPPPEGGHADLHAVSTTAESVVAAEQDNAAPGPAATDGPSRDGGHVDLRKLFDTLDQDRSGAVEKKEWGKFLQANRETLAAALGGVSLRQLGEMFRSIDSDGEGTVTWEEFSVAAAAATTAAEVEAAHLKALRDTFDQLDKDGTGSVDKKEWGQYLRANQEVLAAALGGMTLPQLGRMSRAADADADGTVSWEEFHAAAIAAANSAVGDEGGEVTRPQTAP